LPDFSQPRRLLSADLVEAVSSGRLSPMEAVQQWITPNETSTTGSAHRHNVNELKRLADSIAQHGLINPISVRTRRADESLPPHIEYVIVTGERRFWAQVYLLSQNKHIFEGSQETTPDQIKVTIAADDVSIKAHQLIENLLREDINAVERALGMWALRYELSGVNYSSPAAEALDSAEEEEPVTLVTWAKVEQALGISKRYRIFVTSVLNLCEAAQVIVAEHNLAEMTIRPIVQKLKGRPDLQVKALNQLVAWKEENEADDGQNRAIVASVRNLVEELLADEVTAKESPETKASRAVSSEPVIRFRDKVRQTLDFLDRLKKRDRSNFNEALARSEYADVRLDLRNLRQQIDEILTVVDNVDPDTDESAG
jgi:hypothetical protein